MTSQQQREFDIMVAGHLCLDMIPRFPDTGATQISEIMRPGKLVNMNEAMISTGGPVSNTGRNLKTLGSSVCFCARVGDDVLGRIMIDIHCEDSSWTFDKGRKLWAGPNDRLHEA